jgi:hypothetical protein
LQDEDKKGEEPSSSSSSSSASETSFDPNNPPPVMTETKVHLGDTKVSSVEDILNSDEHKPDYEIRYDRFVYSYYSKA